jgi:PTH1 family peptidyl-tRNA hydrolase
MAIVIVGLGNPGKEYEKTRHNAGRMVVEYFAKNCNMGEFTLHKKSNALVAEGKVGKEKVTLVLPETFMNNSGKAVVHFVKSVKAGKDLIVIRDDLDLPVGAVKMTYGRGSGGHKGVESVMRAIKTDQFSQIKIGISGQGKKNQAKKVSGEERVLKHVVGKFKPTEESAAKKAIKKAALAAETFVTDSLEKAVMIANTR